MNKNLSAVKSIYDAFLKGDIPTVISHMDKNVQWEAWESHSAHAHKVPWLMPKKGKEGVMEFFGVIGQLNLQKLEVLSMMAGENQVAVEIRGEFGESDLGKSFTDEEMHLWTFNEEGKVTRFRHYCDSYKHIHAVKIKEAV